MSNTFKMTPIRRKGAQLKARGYSNTQIAKRLKLSKSTVANWYSNSTFKNEVEHYTEKYLEENDKLFTRTMNLQLLPLTIDLINEVLNDPFKLEYRTTTSIEYDNISKEVIEKTVTARQVQKYPTSLIIQVINIVLHSKLKASDNEINYNTSGDDIADMIEASIQLIETAKTKDIQSK